MNEYVKYENMRYEMAECAEVVRRVLGLTVPVSILQPQNICGCFFVYKRYPAYCVCKIQRKEERKC